MSISERTYEQVKKPPGPLQAEVLDFVEYLASKIERESTSGNALASTSLSLSLAMRGMEHVDTPSYSTRDLREAF